MRTLKFEFSFLYLEIYNIKIGIPHFYLGEKEQVENWNFQLQFYKIQFKVRISNFYLWISNIKVGGYILF